MLLPPTCMLHDNACSITCMLTLVTCKICNMQKNLQHAKNSQHVKMSTCSSNFNIHAKNGPYADMRFFSNMHVGSVTCQKSHVNMQKNTCQHAAPFPDEMETPMVGWRMGAVHEDVGLTVKRRSLVGRGVYSKHIPE